MKVAVLPFNAAEGTKPALGRQFAAFAAEQLRTQAGADINTISYLTQIEGEDGTRVAFVNISDGMTPAEQLAELFQQTQVELISDGFLKEIGGGFEITQRFHVPGGGDPKAIEVFSFNRADLFVTLHRMVKRLADHAEVGLPEFLAGETMEFGTDNAEAFLGFLEGYDAVNYIQQANGMVAKEFSPQPAIDVLLEATQADLDFEGPYQVLIQLTRACANYRIGTFEMLEKALTDLARLLPEEFLAYFALGEVYQSINAPGKAAEAYEKALSLEPNDPALYTRLGVAQLQSGMPVNAERNFRKAVDMEGEEKPSADFLANVLVQTGRAHEVPPLWKGLLDNQQENAVLHAKYAMSLVQAGKKPEGIAAFEAGLMAVTENTVVKRVYAPLLVQNEDLDRAMDFYEDCLDEAPNDIPLLLEYAQTLEAADRSFEVPAVLKNVLASNPDVNIRAQALARLIELEQPKRAESVDNARAKMESGDFAGAIKDLKPLRNWLADYWKLWALLSSAYNRTDQFTDAEESAKRLIELFPGCEPAYGEFSAALSGQGRLEEAYNFMKFAANNNPSSLPIHINLALAAKRAGQEDEARALAKQIREAVGPNPEIEELLRDIDA